ncbi:hypothetical protein ACKWTF_014690 [Chironomus riparius]
MPQDSIPSLIIRCKCQPKILRQALWTYQNGISMLKNHFLFAATEEVMQKFIPMGLIQHSYDLHNWICLRPIIEPEDTEPIVLTMDELEFGFILWLTVCAVSILGFFCEILLSKIGSCMGISFLIGSMVKRPVLH